jgi:hypothetical protein
MNNKLITLTSANRYDSEGGSAGIEIIVNPEHITHFHKAEQREGNATHIHFVSGQVALVTQTVQEVRELVQPTPMQNRGSRNSMGTS